MMIIRILIRIVTIIVLMYAQYKTTQKHTDSLIQSDPRSLCMRCLGENTAPAPPRNIQIIIQCRGTRKAAKDSVQEHSGREVIYISLPIQRFKGAYLLYYMLLYIQTPESTPSSLYVRKIHLLKSNLSGSFQSNIRFIFRSIPV